jgi:hypothetical protein
MLLKFIGVGNEKVFFEVIGKSKRNDHDVNYEK